MILTAKKVFGGAKDALIENGAVCIEGDKVVMAGAKEDVLKMYPDQEVVDFGDATILPGMIDLHNHVGDVEIPKYGRDYQEGFNSAALRTLFAANRMKETLEAGVTTIRDVCGPDGIALALRRAAEDKLLKAPRILTCNMGICMTGGHGADALCGGVIEADGVEEVRKAIRLNFKQGADWIKILTSECYRGEELSFEELKAAADEVHRMGKRISAHAGFGASIENCIKAGYDSIEHGTHLTKEQAEYMRDHDQTLVPTVLVFNYVNEHMSKMDMSMLDPYSLVKVRYLKDCVESYKQNLRMWYDTGVRMATGTDTDCTDYLGAAPVAVECVYMVECGLTPAEAMECATKNGAECLGFGDWLGQLKEGYAADIIVVKGDAAEDISCLKDVVAVYQAGEKVV